MSEMSDLETLTRKTLESRLVVTVIEEQAGNWTQERFSKGVVYHQVYDQLVSFATLAIRLVYEKNITKPNIETADWKINFSDETQKVSIDAGLKNEIDNFICGNNFPKFINVSREIMEYSLMKIASRAIPVSFMIAFGLNPELLMMSSEEIFTSQMKLAKALAEAEKPVTLAVVHK